LKKKENMIVIDTGSLIEILENTKIGEKFHEIILKDPELEQFLVSPFVATELKYILCRKFGFNEANQKINNFLKNFVIWKEEILRDRAARFKCQYLISLADCYSLALAKIQNAPLYMKKETEIENIIQKLVLEVHINFIDDL